MDPNLNTGGSAEVGQSFAIPAGPAAQGALSGPVNHRLQWDQLLGSRPGLAGGEQQDGQTKEWLVRALQLSNQYTFGENANMEEVQTQLPPGYQPPST